MPISEDITKAEFNRQLLWLVFSLIPAIFFLFLSAYIIGHGSFDFLNPIPFIVFLMFWLGIVIWGSGRMASLQPDWKTLSIGRRGVLVGGCLWKICTFQGLGTKRQEYLNLVAERMVKKDFKRVGEIKLETWGQYLYIKDSDLTFESPEGEYQTGIRAVSIGENLRVGFNHKGTLKILKKAVLMFAFSLIFALFVSFLFVNIVEYAFPSIDVTQLGVLWIIVFFPVMFGLWISIVGKKKRVLDRQIKKFLVDTAEYMGSKQITPFKRITVKYE